MAEEYRLASGSISVFPTTKRTYGNKSSRLLSEANLVNIVNMLLDRDSFIISNIQDELTATFSSTNGYQIDNDKGLEINILGYYFKISKISDILNAIRGNSNLTGTIDIYANIRTIAIGDYIELYGTDNEESNSNEFLYDGLILSKNINITNDYLKILTVYETSIPGETTEDSTVVIKCKVPKESMIKFVGRSIDNLDCGEI